MDVVAIFVFWEGLAAGREKRNVYTNSGGPYKRQFAFSKRVNDLDYPKSARKSSE
jgi:hypothetical protein